MSTSLPPVKQTLPGRTRPYRLFTVDHDVDFAEMRSAGYSLVTIGQWGTSYTHTYGEEGVELHVYDVRTDRGETIKHDLYGTRYDTQAQASQAAFEAGVLAFMVFEDVRLGVPRGSLNEIDLDVMG